MIVGEEKKDEKEIVNREKHERSDDNAVSSPEVLTNGVTEKSGRRETSDERTRINVFPGAEDISRDYRLIV